jgi:hypothetical protein
MRRAFVMLMAVFASACSSGDEAAGPDTSPASVLVVGAELDGVQFDVRRDPG